MDRIVTKDGSIIEESIRRGERLGRMIIAMRRGATLEQMKARFADFDEGTYQVLQMILDGTISDGKQEMFNHTQNTASKIEARRRGLFRMFDAGYTAKEVSGRTGLTYGYVKRVHSLWTAQEKGE